MLYQSMMIDVYNKIRTYGNKVNTNFRGLNVPEDDIKCESFIVISVDSIYLFMKANITCRYI